MFAMVTNWLLNIYFRNNFFAKHWCMHRKLIVSEKKYPIWMKLNSWFNISLVLSKWTWHFILWRPSALPTVFFIPYNQIVIKKCVWTNWKNQNQLIETDHLQLFVSMQWVAVNEIFWEIWVLNSIPFQNQCKFSHEPQAMFCICFAVNTHSMSSRERAYGTCSWRDGGKK